MKTIFIVIQQSVYRHDIIAASEDLQSAFNLAICGIDAEDDHYHSAVVIEIQMDENLIPYEGNYNGRMENVLFDIEYHSSNGRFKYRWTDE